jgi:hypothetical protein
MDAGFSDPAPGKGGRLTPFKGTPFRTTLVRVIAVQVITLLLLWLLQITFRPL